MSSIQRCKAKALLLGWWAGPSFSLYWRVGLRGLAGWLDGFVVVLVGWRSNSKVSVPNIVFQTKKRARDVTPLGTEQNKKRYLGPERVLNRIELEDSMEMRKCGRPALSLGTITLRAVLSPLEVVLFRPCDAPVVDALTKQGGLACARLHSRAPSSHPSIYIYICIYIYIYVYVCVSGSR